MMKAIAYIFIFSIVLSSCSKKGIQSYTYKEKGVSQKLKFSANNLSEDVTILSTHNDELILLVYSNLEREFPKLVLKEEFIIDSIGTNLVFDIKEKIPNGENLIIALIEVDTDKKIEEIEPVVNTNLKTLLELFQYQDLTEIIKILGDDDLMFIKKITLKKFKENNIRIQGISLFDAYDYLMEID